MFPYSTHYARLRQAEADWHDRWSVAADAAARIYKVQQTHNAHPQTTDQTRQYWANMHDVAAREKERAYQRWLRACDNLDAYEQRCQTDDAE